ncbi:hypothetical protein GEMRC1_003875 [Eukaryota sp. GEM-RC1]
MPSSSKKDQDLNSNKLHLGQMLHGLRHSVHKTNQLRHRPIEPFHHPDSLNDSDYANSTSSTDNETEFRIDSTSTSRISLDQYAKGDNSRSIIRYPQSQSIWHYCTLDSESEGFNDQVDQFLFPAMENGPSPMIEIKIVTTESDSICNDGQTEDGVQSTLSNEEHDSSRASQFDQSIDYFNSLIPSSPIKIDCLQHKNDVPIDMVTDQPIDEGQCNNDVIETDQSVSIIDSTTSMMLVDFDAVNSQSQSSIIHCDDAISQLVEKESIEREELSKSETNNMSLYDQLDGIQSEMVVINESVQDSQSSPDQTDCLTCIDQLQSGVSEKLFEKLEGHDSSPGIITNDAKEKEKAVYRY